MLDLLITRWRMKMNASQSRDQSRVEGGGSALGRDARECVIAQRLP
jgi:hypothetical protein